MDESQLKAQIRPVLHKDFEVLEEVPGHFLVDDTNVKIDFLMKPRGHLVERGFDDDWVGLEVKSPDTGAGIRLAWQAITYAQSSFNGRRPQFVLVFPHIDDFFPALKCEGPTGLYERSSGHEVKCLLQKANVGSFILFKNGRDWKIEFGAHQTYFSSTKGRSKIANIGQRRVSGTWK